MRGWLLLLGLLTALGADAATLPGSPTHGPGLLPRGRDGGQSLVGGRASSELLDLYANDQALNLSNNGRVRVMERMTLMPDGFTVPTGAHIFMTLGGTGTTTGTITLNSII